MIIQKAIANQDKKPFTYIPGGGVDFARLRAERLQRGQKAYHHFLNKKVWNIYKDSFISSSQFLIHY